MHDTARRSSAQIEPLCHESLSGHRPGGIKDLHDIRKRGVEVDECCVIVKAYRQKRVLIPLQGLNDRPEGRPMNLISRRS
jgi:hypothetical protein